MVFLDLFTSASLILLVSQALDQQISCPHEQSPNVPVNNIPQCFESTGWGCIFRF